MGENEDSNQFEDSYDDKTDRSDEDEEDDDDNDENKSVKQAKKVLGETKPLTDEAIAEYNAKLKKTGVVRITCVFLFLGISKFYPPIHDLELYYKASE